MLEDQIIALIAKVLENFGTVTRFTPSVVNGRRFLGVTVKGTDIMLQVDNLDKNDGS
jgi:hypothetical protein